ncbi:MAG: polymerase, partial [Sporomusaceae bacterium]|nr:polymerase [Sporomusaceae bacterium]
MCKENFIHRFFYSLDQYIEYSLILVVFFLPLSLDLTTYCLMGSFGLWLVKLLYRRKWLLRSTPFDLIIGFLTLFSFASVWGSPDVGFSFYNYYNLMGRYLLIYYLVVHNVHSL